LWYYNLPQQRWYGRLWWMCRSLQQTVIYTREINVFVNWVAVMHRMARCNTPVLSCLDTAVLLDKRRICSALVSIQRITCGIKKWFYCPMSTFFTFSLVFVNNLRWIEAKAEQMRLLSRCVNNSKLEYSVITLVRLILSEQLQNTSCSSTLVGEKCGCKWVSLFNVVECSNMYYYSHYY